MAIGNLLQGREQQYVANQDDKGTWRVLDTWHEALKSMQPEDDVEDDNPAITVLTEGGFIALVREAARSGTLENAVLDRSEESLILDLKEQIRTLQEELTIEKHERALANKSLQETAMEHVVRLAAMDSMSTLSK